MKFHFTLMYLERKARGFAMYESITIESYDSTELAADFYQYSNAEIGVLLTHGITSERTEAGLYTNFAERLLTLGFSSLLLDLRSHGESSGRQEDFFLSGAINDICSGIDFLNRMRLKKIVLISASFSGGLSVRAAELKNDSVSHLILLNPRLTYTPWIKDPSFWENGQLSVSAKNYLKKYGYIERNGFKLGKPMINELLTFDPIKGIYLLEKPILFVHGTKDTVIPIDETRKVHNQYKKSDLFEVDNAQHGFTDPETDNPATATSQKLRELVVDKVINWIATRVLGGK